MLSVLGADAERCTLGSGFCLEPLTLPFLPELRRRWISSSSGVKTVFAVSWTELHKDCVPLSSEFQLLVAVEDTFEVSVGSFSVSTVFFHVEEALDLIFFWNSSSVTVFTTFVVCSETTFAVFLAVSDNQPNVDDSAAETSSAGVPPSDVAGGRKGSIWPSGHHRQISLVNVLSPLDEDEVRVPSVSRWGFQRWCSSDYHRLSRPKMTVGIASFVFREFIWRLLSVPQSLEVLDGTKHTLASNIFCVYP